MAEITIFQAKKYWDVSDCLSVSASVVAASSNGATGTLKKGYPVFADGNGGYVAYAGANIVSQKTNVGIIMEDIEDIATATVVKVMYAGKCYVEGVREAGVTDAMATEQKLNALAGKIVFVGNKEINA